MDAASEGGMERGKDKRLFFDGVRRRLKAPIKAGFHRPIGRQ